MYPIQKYISVFLKSKQLKENLIIKQEMETQQPVDIKKTANKAEYLKLYREANKEKQQNYSKHYLKLQKKCDICQVSVGMYAWSAHKKSKKHQLNTLLYQSDETETDLKKQIIDIMTVKN